MQVLETVAIEGSEKGGGIVWTLNISEEWESCELRLERQAGARLLKVMGKSLDFSFSFVFKY